MTPFIITADELAAISAAIARARVNPIPWEMLRDQVVDDPTPFLRLDQRKGGGRPESETIILSAGFRLNISFEIQPSGLCQHISVSCSNPAEFVPNEAAFKMIAEACGMQWPAGPRSRVWLEDFIAGSEVGKAINLVEVIAT